MRKSEKIHEISLVLEGGYGLTQGIELELATKIDETNKELEKAGNSILQIAKLLSQAKNLVKLFVIPFLEGIVNRAL